MFKKIATAGWIPLILLSFLPALIMVVIGTVSEVHLLNFYYAQSVYEYQYWRNNYSEKKCSQLRNIYNSLKTDYKNCNQLPPQDFFSIDSNRQAVQCKVRTLIEEQATARALVKAWCATYPASFDGWDSNKRYPFSLGNPPVFVAPPSRLNYFINALPNAIVSAYLYRWYKIIWPITGLSFSVFWLIKRMWNEPNKGIKRLSLVSGVICAVAVLIFCLHDNTWTEKRIFTAGFYSLLAAVASMHLLFMVQRVCLWIKDGFDGSSSKKLEINFQEIPYEKISTSTSTPTAQLSSSLTAEAINEVPLVSARFFDRIWARAIDLAFAYWVANLVILFIPSSLIFTKSEDVYWMFLFDVIVFIFIFDCLIVLADAWMLSNWGSSPGKWLLGIKVVTKEGALMDFRTASCRAQNMLRSGLYYNFFFPYAQMAVALWFRGTKSIPWDVIEGSRVVQSPISRLRRLVGAITGVMLALSILVAVQMGKEESKKTIIQTITGN